MFSFEVEFHYFLSICNPRLATPITRREEANTPAREYFGVRYQQFTTSMGFLAVASPPRNRFNGFVQIRTRRDFFSLAGKGIGLAALSSATIAALLENVQAATKSIDHLSPEEAAAAEDYWATIQNSFVVGRGIINLNNGGVSPSRRI